VKILVLDVPAVRKSIRRVVSYANTPEHWVREDDATPPNLSEHACLVPINYQCTYFVLFVDGSAFRHLSVSTPGVATVPDPVAMERLAELFGFSGVGRVVWQHPKLPCASVIEPLP
jgi:hypothetical protein